MPEERDIEKQLRAAAEQRRREAGGKFELHSATRRLLHGEIQRVHGPKTTALGGRNPIFAGLWLRFAAGGCTVGILVVATWLMFFRASPPAPTQLAKNETLRAATPADRAAASGELSASRLQPPAAPLAKAKALPPGANAGYVQTAAPLSPPRAEIPAVPARGAADFSKAKLSDAAVEKPTAPPLAQNFRYLNNAGTAGGRRQKDTLATLLAAQTTESAITAKVARPAAVLNSFQVEQRGDQLRIVDGDGSVYAGQLLAATEGDKEFKSTALAAERSVAMDAMANVRFTAAGTNLSLKQNVVINAAFVNGSIVGHAVLADGQRVPLDATPANP